MKFLLLLFITLILFSCFSSASFTDDLVYLYDECHCKQRMPMVTNYSFGEDCVEVYTWNCNKPCTAKLTNLCMEVNNITDWIPLEINKSDNSNDSLPTIMPDNIARIIEEGEQKRIDADLIEDEFIEDTVVNNENNIIEDNIDTDDIAEDNQIKDGDIKDNTLGDNKPTKTKKFFLFAFWDWFIGLFK